MLINDTQRNKVGTLAMLLTTDIVISLCSLFWPPFPHLERGGSFSGVLGFSGLSFSIAGHPLLELQPWNTLLLPLLHLPQPSLSPVPTFQLEPQG